MTKRSLLSLAATVLLAACSTSSAKQVQPLLTRIRDVTLPGNTSRYDYASVEPIRHLLFLAHLGASEVVVVDLADDVAPSTVKGIAAVHGVLAPITSANWFATATGTDEVVAFGVDDNVETWRVKVGRFPDGLGFDDRRQVLAVSNKNDGSISLITLKNGRPIGTTTTVGLGHETGNVVFDEGSDAFLVATTPNDSLQRLTSSGQRQGTTRLKGCRGAHGIAIATQQRLALIACENNASVAVVDLRTGKQLDLLKVGSGPDVLAYDPDLQRVYVAAESGPTTVISVASGKAAVIGRERVGTNAHTVAVDTSTGAVYFALKNESGRAVLRVMSPTDIVQ